MKRKISECTGNVISWIIVAIVLIITIPLIAITVLFNMIAKAETDSNNA